MKGLKRKIPVVNSVQKVAVIKDAWNSRASIFSMLRDIWRGRYRATLHTKLVLFFALFYIIFPVDFIPDFLPFLGWADDGFVFFALLRRLRKEAERHATMRMNMPEDYGRHG